MHNKSTVLISLKIKNLEKKSFKKILKNLVQCTVMYIKYSMHRR